MRLKAIAVNTFKEAVRNKVFYLLIVVGILFAFSSHIMGLLTIGDRVKVLKDVGLAAINFFSILIAIFTGINLVYKEIDRKTIFNILSKPVSRASFILGKFFGLSLTLLVALASMAVIFFLFLWLDAGEFDGKILVFFLLLYLELLIVNAISVLFSSFSTPILASIFTISLYLIGHISWTFNAFKHNLVRPVEKGIAYFFYYLMPNLEKLNIKNQVVLNTPLDAGVILDSIMYAVCYIAAVLILAILIFNKKEFQ